MHTSSVRPSFDWTLMRSFHAVVERGSVLGASRHLGVSQPTVSRHIAELERQLGVALFERTGRGLAASAAARAIAAQAAQMASTAGAIERILAAESVKLSGSVRITASQIVAIHLLPPILAALRAQEPGIAVEIVSSNALSNLLRRDADIAVRMVRPSQTSLIARRIGSVDIGVYASKDYLLARGVPQRPEDLLRHDLIGFDHDDQILRSFHKMGMPISRDAFTTRSDDHAVMWESLRTGLGIGFAATWLAERESRVERVLPTLAIPPLPVWLTVHREIRSSARIRVVYDFLARAIPEAIGR